jgi:hypothetical protein
MDFENQASAILDPLNSPPNTKSVLGPGDTATVQGNKGSTSSRPAPVGSGVSGNSAGTGAVAPDFPDDSAAADFLEAQQRAAAERLQLFHAMLTKRRQDAIQARAASGVERRWLDDLDAYHGRDAQNRRVDIMDSARGEQIANRQTPQQGQAGKRSTVFVQLTRQKTNAAAARASDMLYPTDDKNWGIKPTPVPELMDALQKGMNQEYQDPTTGGPLQHPDPQQGGRNITYADLAAEVLADAATKAKAMEKEIDDQLTECNYNSEGRKIIQDAAMYGTGVLKGPAVVNKMAKKWQKVTDPKSGKSVQMLQIQSVIKPQSYRVDPWNFYPDPSCGEDIQTGAYVFEREHLPGRELAKMGKIPTYNQWAIAQCLREGPTHIRGEGNNNDNQRAGDLAYGLNSSYDDTRYEIWTYTGDVSREDLEVVGVVLPDTTEGWLQTFSAVIVMCNNRIIKAMLNPLETGDFPYDVFCWERVALSPFGVGIPYLMRYAQRTLNAAWRAMLDNMALSSGPQIIMNKRSVTPADGKWELTARKLWWMEDGDDVEKAFQSFEITSHQQDLANIIDLAQKFADEETSLPQIAQGEKGTAPDTVGGMSILMNSANTVLRRIVKQFDDSVTRPHLRRYYDWNMQFNEKEEIKGDFEVDARGSSVLIVRDLEQQGIMNTMQMAKDPDYSIYVNKKKLFEKALEMQHVPADEVMNTPEEIAAIQQQQSKTPPPQDPRIEAANIKAASDQKIAAAKLEGENQYAQTQAQIARDSHASQMALAEVNREIAILTLSNKTGMQLTQIKADLATVAMQLTSQHSFKHEGQMTQASQTSGPADSATPQTSPDAELTA